MDEDTRRALEALAALAQEHNQDFGDGRPVFGINKAVVRMGDVRAAVRALEAAERKPVKRRKRGELERLPVALVPGINPDAWNDWLAYRKARGLAMYTERGAKANWKWLAAKSAVEQQAIVDQSIQHNYQGLFDLKGVGINGQSKGRYDRLGEEFERRAAGRLAVEQAPSNVRGALSGSIRGGTE